MKRIGKKLKASPEQTLAEHLKLLDLRSLAEYVVWCRKHGFSDHPFKHRKERERELEFSKNQAALVNRQPRIVRSRNPWQIVKSICEGDMKNETLTIPHLVHFAQQLDPPAPDAPERTEVIDREAMLELLPKLDSQRCQFLFEPLLACPRFGQSPENTFLAALARIAAYRREWVRPIRSWTPTTHNPRRQFSSLFHHLLDKHGEVPESFVSAWFQGDIDGADRYRKWAIVLGSGVGLRGCDLPIPYTRGLWQCLRRAPENLLTSEALRWAQVVSLQGSPRLADVLLRTRIANRFEQEEFWSEVIKWFIANPMLDTVHAGPIVDYLHQQRFVPALREGRNGSLAALTPRQPNLTMKGRSAESLLKHVRGWHNTLHYANVDPTRCWASTGVPQLTFEEGERDMPNHKAWTIRELLSQADLNAEGKKLRHCVSSYSNSCMSGHCSIWTLELQTDSGIEKLITIEVRPILKQIVQARGRLNRYPTEAELAVIRRWASVAGLRLCL
ncbi:MAG: PcfJ domain-containing protein [Pirellulales bacterium]